MDGKKHIVAVTAVISKGNKYLVLQRGADEIAFPNRWAFPGGKLEKGEDILSVLKREVLEETGLEIEDQKHYLRDFTFVRPDGHNVVGLNFLVFAKEGDVSIASDFEDYKWVSKDELLELEHLDGMGDSIEIASRLITE
jgi:mutator protein MutT